MIIGISIESIDAKKIAPHQGKIRIDHNATIKNLSEISVPLFPKEKMSKIDFEFRTVYFPDGNDKKEIAKIVIGGHVIYKEMPAKAKTYWKKNKKLPEEIALPIINHVLRKGILKSVEISESLLLPPPINLPTLTSKQPAKTEKIQKENKKSDTTYIG